MAVFLLLPESKLVADSKHKYPFYDIQKRHKFVKSRGFPHSTRKELQVLKEAVEQIGRELEELKSQTGNIPLELAEKLAALQQTVDNNSSDISLALTDIVGILESISTMVSDIESHSNRLNSLEASVSQLDADIAALGTMLGDLESRVSALEQDAPTMTDNVVFSGTFSQGQVASIETQQAWTDFKNNATGFFGSIEIRNSSSNGAICNDPVAVTQIANELNTHLVSNNSITSFSCGTQTWNVGTCGAGIELNAGFSASVCECGQGAVVRPRVGNNNWGGVGSDFGGSGGTCFAPSQTLEVILTR